MVHILLGWRYIMGATVPFVHNWELTVLQPLMLVVIHQRTLDNCTKFRSQDALILCCMFIIRYNPSLTLLPHQLQVSVWLRKHDTTL